MTVSAPATSYTRIAAKSEAQGKGIKPIMRELGLAKETVRRFYRAPTVEELVAKPRGRAAQHPG